MLDKTIKYYDVLMHRKTETCFPQSILPENYKFVLFKSGDEKDWAEIETSVGEFECTADALECFRRDYFPYLFELERRCIFIENENGYKVATFTIWWGYTGVRRDPWLHWIAVRPEYQGMGLGKSIVFEGMKRLIDIEGDRSVYLHTQTWSYKAINIYRKAGFNITAEKSLAGYANDDYEKASLLLKNYLR